MLHKTRRLSRGWLAQRESVHLPIQRSEFDSASSSRWIFLYPRLRKIMQDFNLFEFSLSSKNRRCHLLEKENGSYTFLLNEREHVAWTNWPYDIWQMSSYIVLCNTTNQHCNLQQYQLSNLINSGVTVMTAIDQDKEETVEYSKASTIEGLMMRG